MMTATTWCLGRAAVTRRGQSNSLADQTLGPRTVAFQAFEMANYHRQLSRLLPVGSPGNQQIEIGIYQTLVAETAAADQTQGVSAMACPRTGPPRRGLDAGSASHDVRTDDM
jgi:hypothetical protein